jgi:hypothetical protein
MRLKYRILCVISVTSLFLASCKEPEEVAPSSQFVLSKKIYPTLSRKSDRETVKHSINL